MTKFDQNLCGFYALSSHTYPWSFEVNLDLSASGLVYLQQLVEFSFRVA